MAAHAQAGPGVRPVPEQLPPEPLLPEEVPEGDSIDDDDEDSDSVTEDPYSPFDEVPPAICVLEPHVRERAAAVRFDE